MCKTLSKTAYLKAHNRLPGDALWACRSTTFQSIEMGLNESKFDCIVGFVMHYNNALIGFITLVTNVCNYA